MRFKINGKWKNGYTNDGILFFAQRIEEMLMYYTSHIYKVPVYNTYLLIEEYASTAQLVRQKAVNQTHLSLILEEFYSQLSSDVVIKDHYSQDEIDHFIGRLRGCSIEEQGRIMHYLWHIMGQYPEWCKETIKKCVASPKEKKKIESALRSFIPMLIGAGYSPKYIYRFCRKTFSSVEISDDTILDTFLDRFDWRRSEYVVYFAVSKRVEVFKTILESRLDISFEEDDYSRKVPLNEEEICIHLSVNALDSDIAVDEAYQQFNLFCRYYKFLGNRNEEWCGDKSIVKDSSGRYYDRVFKPQGYSYSQDYDSRTLGTNSEYIITNLLENAERKDFYKLNKIIRTHNLSLISADMGNGFLNLWSIMEIISVNHRDDSKIKEIMNAVIPVLKKGYFSIVFEELHDYLKANLDREIYKSLLEEVAEEGDEEFKIACFVIMKKYDAIRQKAYSYLANYPLIRSRISQLYTDIFSDKKKLLLEFDRYDQRLRWHIQRLYRTRNSIIHSGENPNNIKSLGEHLHDYVDELLEEIVNKLTQPNSLVSIENVIIHAQICMDKIYRTFKGGGELSEQDVRIILEKTT